MVRNVLAIFVILFLVSACSGTAPVPSQATATPAGPYPAPGINVTSAYPGPASNQKVVPTPTIEPTQTPNPTMAMVTGVLLVAGKPVEGILRLAEILTDASGKETAAGLNPTTAPQAVPNASGKFVFINVNAGKYAVVFDDSTQAFVLPKPDGSGPLLVTVPAGKTTDMGKLEYSQMPGK